MVIRILVYGMSENSGGIESYLINYLRLFNRDEVTFDFVYDSCELAHKDEILQMGSKIYQISPKRKHPIRQIMEFYKILRDHPEYKIIYFNLLSASSLFVMFASILDGKRTNIVHSHNGSVGRYWLHWLCRPILTHYADYCFACSQVAANFMFGKGNKAKIITNAIDLRQYMFDKAIRSEMRKQLNVDANIVIGVVGRISPQKNPLYIVDIFKSIHDIASNAVLLWLGTGVMEQEVKEKISSFGLDNSVQLLGIQNEVNKYLQAMDAFLLPSLFEGLPVVGVEAQASGLPCFFSSSISPEIELVPTLCHFLSIEASPDIWAESILNNYRLRMDTYNILKEKGLDIYDEAKILESIFRRINDKQE